MNFMIVAKDSGKTIQVKDRIANKIAFDSFLDPGQSATINVASNDGAAGSIDIYKALQGSANTVHETDYDVRKDEIMEIDD